jgi:cytidine deaminase
LPNSDRSWRPGERLIDAAAQARERAVAPYSGFQVGAALESRDGAVITGCNIENASWGLTMCAERVALFKALSEGHRGFRRLVIVTGATRPSPPCGACRQLLWEFCGDVQVIAATLRGGRARWGLRTLLAHPFDERSIAPPSRKRGGPKPTRGHAGRTPSAKR